MKNYETLKTQLESRKTRSAWEKGVNLYALEMLEELAEHLEYEGKTFDDIETMQELKKYLLNGADNFHDFSYGGCSLIYDWEICERLCPPSIIERKKNGFLAPNSCETWLDVQTRALRQAYNLLYRYGELSVLVK